MRDPRCDSDCEGVQHEPGCAYWSARTVDDPAALAAAEDGYPSLRAAIRHPSHSATRAYLKTNPFPRQTRGAAA